MSLYSAVSPRPYKGPVRVMKVLTCKAKPAIIIIPVLLNKGGGKKKRKKLKK